VADACTPPLFSKTSIVKPSPNAMNNNKARLILGGSIKMKRG
jgi:hypothetical protein